MLIVQVLLFLFSCSNDYCNQITDKINIKYQQDSEDEITLDLNEVFDFEWDTLYICGPYGFDQEISLSIGFKTQYDYVKEGETLFTFIKDDKLVEEKLINCNSISFFHSNEYVSECIKIKSSDATFKVKSLSNKRKNYILRE